MEGSVKVKFSKSEIQLLVNSLHMSISTVVPCMENGQWKKPYEKLRKDLENITNQLIEKEREITINGKTEEKSGSNRGVLISCEHDAYVIITKSENSEELGKKYISSNTSVKEITKV